MMKINHIKWRCIPNTKGKYQLSTDGSVRKINKYGENFKFANIFSTIYDEVLPISKSKKKDNQQFKYQVIPYKKGNVDCQNPLSTLLYEVFHGIINLDVDEILYIDRNTSNNNINNLMLCQKDEWHRIMLNGGKHNLMKITNSGIMVFTENKSKCISVYNINGYRVGVFKNKNELMRHIKIQPAKLNAALNASAGYCENNFIYKYGYGPYLINTSEIILNNLYCGEKLTRLKNKIVIQYTVSGKFVEAYNNIYEASAKTKIQAELIEKHLKNQYVFKDSIWIYG